MSFIRSPLGQVTIMGIVFLLIFTAYITIQAFASKLYGDTLGSNMALTLYAVFTVACFIAPAITNVLGPRFTLFLGSLGYAALVAASLVLAVSGSGPVTDTFVVLGGACCGLGAALLWTAQGRMMLEWSSGSDQGTIFAVFWALFNLSALVGGLLTFFYFADHDISDQKSLWPLYVVFLACIIGGGAVTQLLTKDASEARGVAALASSTHVAPADGNHVPPGAPGLHHLDPALPVNGSVAEAGAGMPGDSDWYVEALATVRLFRTRTMMILAPLMWYTGFNQPYQLNTFGDRYFGARTLGLEVIVFYAAEIVGGFTAGWLLDWDPSQPRKAALRQLAIFAAVTTVGYALAFPQEWNAAQRDWPSSDVTPIRLNETAIAPPTLAYAFWGISDSQVQAYAYWLMRNLYDDASQQSRAVGFYKMIQSLGWCVGFALVPSKRMPPLIQMGLTFVCAVVGTVLALFRLPSSRSESKGTGGTEREAPLLAAAGGGMGP